MTTKLVFLVTAAAIAGSAFAGSAIAQDQNGRSDRMDRSDHSDRMDRSDRNEITANQLAAENDVRIARMKADLRLTPDQEKNWAGLESELRNSAKKRAERQIAFRAERAKQTGPEDMIVSMNREADSLSQRADDLKKLADAAKPLYASLDEQQKKRFSHSLMRAIRD